jgi:hypothetical protein
MNSRNPTLFRGTVLFSTGYDACYCSCTQGKRLADFDPIGHALTIYLDAVNLFFYILRIFLDQVLRPISFRSYDSLVEFDARIPPWFWGLGSIIEFDARIPLRGLAAKPESSSL